MFVKILDINGNYYIVNTKAIAMIHFSYHAEGRKAIYNVNLINRIVSINIDEEEYERLLNRLNVS